MINVTKTIGSITIPATVPQARQNKGDSVPAPAVGRSDVVRISDVAQQKSLQEQANASQETGSREQAKTQTESQAGNKAYFAVDDDQNVVIRVVDKDGKVIRQLPPEDYLDTQKKLREMTEQLFHVKG